MSTRREGREWAVHILFQLDLNPDREKNPAELFKEFWDGQIRLRDDKASDLQPPGHIRSFTEELVGGVMKRRGEIDKLISSIVKNWDIKRIGTVERNVLRMGIFEICFAQEKTPQPVVINEAVDICKFFGTRESGRFVNGILDKIARSYNEEQNKPQEWSPAQ